MKCSNVLSIKIMRSNFGIGFPFAFHFSRLSVKSYHIILRFVYQMINYLFVLNLIRHLHLCMRHTVFYILFIKSHNIFVFK